MSERGAGRGGGVELAKKGSGQGEVEILLPWPSLWGKQGIRDYRQVACIFSIISHPDCHYYDEKHGDGNFYLF